MVYVIGLGQWPTHVAHMSEGKMSDVRALDDHFEELEAIKKENYERRSLDSPLMELCYKWLRNDRKRRLAHKEPPVDPETGLPHTHWDDLGADMEKYGDKYYNYWK
jgi:CCR4-NOT complex subunit CAF16